jgi:hypothetical protein
MKYALFSFNHFTEQKKGNPIWIPFLSVVTDYYFPVNLIVVFPVDELVPPPVEVLLLLISDSKANSLPLDSVTV